MKKTSRSLLAVAFLGLCLMGSPSPTFAAASVEAGPRLKLKTGQSLTGLFVHEHPVQGFEKPLRTEGSFTVSGSNNIVWAIEKPMMTTTTISPEGGLTQSVGTYALLKINPQQMPFLVEMQKKLLLALSGDWDKLEDEFTVDREGGAEAWKVTLTPKLMPNTPRKPFRQIVAHGGKFVEKAEVTLPSGTVDRVTFSQTRLIPP